jgi:hypothetical protein
VVAAGGLLVRAVRGSCAGGGDGESATGLQDRSATRFSRAVMARASAACAAAEMIGWRLRLLFLRLGVLAVRAGRLVGRVTSEGGEGWFRRLLSMLLRVDFSGAEPASDISSGRLSLMECAGRGP